ncbi:MAG: NAD-glutamate dehydrogenase [Actinomycetota bacterium]|nr:NAD-glutamate dehydrogenase [Actinomycetota bacterium]
MGDRTGERVPGPTVEDQGPPARILAHLASPDGRPGLLADFARAVLRRVPFGPLDAADPLSVAASLADVFAFVDARAPDAIAVRVVEPPVALDGWPATGSVVEVGCEDRQFIVTTVTGRLHRLGHRVVRDIHPVYGCERATDGRLTAILPARPAARRESFLQVELADRISPADRPALVADLTAVLGDVVAATGDYDAMRARIQAVAAGIRAAGGGPYPADEAREAADLLDWLLDGNFVLTGCCTFRPTGTDAQAGEAVPAMRVVDPLGVLSRPDAPLRGQAPPTAAPAEILRIVRTAEVSRVHRQVPMHRIDVAELAPGGEVSGGFRLVGVFTAKANAEPAGLTPVLRFKLRRILELEDVVERSQDEAALVSLFQVLPKDQLFETAIPSLRGLLLDLLAAEHQHEVRVLLRADPGTRTVAALVSVPAEIYSPTMRHRLERFLLSQLDGTQVDADVSLGDRPEAIVRLVVHVGAGTPMAEQTLAALERELRLLCRTWDEELDAALAARIGSEAARRLVGSWADWFPATYRDAVAPEDAIDDLLQLDALGATDEDGPRVRVVLAADPADPSRTRVKVFAAGEGVELSRFLPIIESLGLWAVEDRPHALGRGSEVVHLHDFGVTDPSGPAIDVVADGRRLADAALALWHGRADADYLNRLVLRAGLTWDDVAVLRAYRRYRSLVGTAFTTDYVDRVLVEHAPIAAALVALFSALFDPVRQAGADVVAELRQRVLDGCDAVARLDHDRILRGYLGLVDATLRTSRWVAPGDHLALKFDSAAVPAMPRPVPYREIFVHGPMVEGVHLRWGPVARGGIRWSDRPDDYRSEVLDLMRAQVLKNAVIVPTGAKGGFVVRRSTEGAAAPTVAAAYEIFVTGMLQVTDDVVGDHVVAVPRRRDGDDPYLVVAADRGTATFSDLANRISAERRFWLGDAFASGGSHGYDHKRLGITARGAWVAVRHHFGELGIDVQAEPVTVVGIGDMSGDVFGNAMLRSDRLRLVAAFDHRDVFVDPDPDPATSYAERARLFAMDRSAWQDYDRAALSPGGGVWSRLDKRIAVSEQARAALRIDAAELTPAELVRAVLRAPVGLLFTGGIGTFVRAGSEPDQDIDDRANAEVRVEGSTVRARVVGEGANLAFTQRARVEYARRGGRINTDAIDNAAGVDISDHEVNLKILLRLACDAGDLTAEERDRVLAAVCDDVTAAVLRDCDLQSVALARARDTSAGHMDALEALMSELEEAGVVDRAVEALPTSEEMVVRSDAGAGLTRPELAVLLAGSKRSLVARLLASQVPDQPALRDALVSYFPPSMASRFDHFLDRHRLRRELVASVVANEVVNRMGPTFVTRLAAETGAGPPAVAAAYWIAREVAAAPAAWAELDGDGRTERPATESVLVAAPMLSGLLEALARDYLRRGETAAITSIVARDRPALVELAGATAGMGTPYRRRLRARRTETLVDAGLDPALAARWACLPELEIGPDAADLARVTGRGVVAVAGVVLQLGEGLGIDRLTDRLQQSSPRDRWGRAAWRGLIDDLDDLRRAAARRALDDAPDQPESEAMVRFLATRAAAVGEVTRLLRDVEATPSPSLDAVAVATRAVRRAIG